MNKMKYLWEIMQYEKTNNTHKTLCLRENLCSAYEVNTSTQLETDLEINIFWRLADIFDRYLRNKEEIISEYYSENADEIENSKQYIEENIEPIFKQIEDYLLHMIGNIDLLSEISYTAIVKNKILQEFLTEDELELFTPEEKDRIATYYIKMKKTGNNIVVFLDILRRFFPKSYVYIHKPTGQVVIYAYCPKNELREWQRKMNVLLELFLDIFYVPYRFWIYHFGVIGVDQTMQINNLLIF